MPRILAALAAVVFAAAFAVTGAAPALAHTAAAARPGGLTVRPSAGAWSASISQARPAGQMQLLTDYSYVSYSGSGYFLDSGGAHGDDVYSTSGVGGDLGWTFTAEGGGLYYMHPSDNTSLCVDGGYQDGGVFFGLESCPKLDSGETMEETGSDPSTHLYWPAFAGSGEACLGSNGDGDVVSGQTCGSEGPVEWDRIPYS